jgi:hypothetical protein
MLGMPSLGPGAQAQMAGPPGYSLSALGAPAGAAPPVAGMKLSMKDMALRGQTASNTPKSEETSTFSFVKEQMKQAQ